MISETDFKALSGASDGVLVSIYLPTHRRGAEIEQDPIRLKNLLGEAEERLAEIEADPEPLAPAFDAARERLDDREFWRHQADGLAVFLSAAGLRMHRLPVTVEEFVLAGDRFCVRPLLPAVSDGSRFHVLTLARNQVRLLECTRTTVREYDTHDIPREIRDVVGYDVEQKALQVHTGSGPTGPGAQRRDMVHHGHGAGEDDTEKETERFLRAVDKAVLRLLEGRLAPLVLAGVERETTEFRHLSHHPSIVDAGVAGNVEHLSAEQLHAAALDVVEPVLDAHAHDRRLAVIETAASDRVVLGVIEALGATAEGRVERLVVCPDAPVWGRVGPRDEVDLHAERRPGDDDLLDRVIAQAMRTGAEILAARPGELPGGHEVAARLRY